MADEKAPKKTMKQSLAEMQESLRKLSQAILPRLGYLYILLLVCAAAYVITSINQTFDNSGAAASASGTQDATTTNFTFVFDPNTVAKVKALNSDAANMNVSLPGGRINPFAE